MGNVRGLGLSNFQKLVDQISHYSSSKFSCHGTGIASQLSIAISRDLLVTNFAVNLDSTFPIGDG
jgi:hypothetical protein